MFRQIRWQIALATVGVLLIGAVLVLFSNRAFVDRPARGGQLVEALAGQPAVVNPLFAVEDAERTLARLVFSGLTRPDPKRGPRADLATHWTVSPDGRTYTFHLREQATWHDGAPITADDVVFTAALARQVATDPSLAVSASNLVKPWGRVTAERLDDHTVALTLEEPYAPFLDATALGILPAHLLADVPPAALMTHRFSQVAPVGSGPYRVDLPGGIDSTGVRLSRFDDHWDATDERPYLDEIVFQFHASPESALEAVGQLDAQTMGPMPAEAFDHLGSDTRLYASTEAGYTLVYLNLDNVLFAEQDVREALSLAVDREHIVHDPALVDGQGSVATSPIAPGSWAHDDSLEPAPFDPARARELLDEAGWIDSDGDGVRDRDGKPLRFALGARDDPLMIAIAGEIADGWSRIGADVTVEPLSQQGTVHALSNRAYDAVLFSWQLRDYEPDPYPLWHSSQIDEGQNFAGYSNPDVDRVLVEARRAHPDDTVGRTALFHEFQRLFVEDQPALLLFHPVFTYAVVDGNLGGVQLPQLLVERADRFTTLPDWFVRTERVFRDSDDDSS